MNGWQHTDYDSTRWSTHFAFWPVRTFDAGWVWLRRYWICERTYGWGFYDRHPYLNLPM